VCPIPLKKPRYETTSKKKQQSDEPPFKIGRACPRHFDIARKQVKNLEREVISGVSRKRSQAEQRGQVSVQDGTGAGVVSFSFPPGGKHVGPGERLENTLVMAHARGCRFPLRPTRPSRFQAARSSPYQPPIQPSERRGRRQRGMRSSEHSGKFLVRQKLHNPPCKQVPVPLR